MRKDNMLKVENYFEVFLIIFLISVFLYLIKDFIMALLFASSIVFLSYKPYKKLVNLTKNETVSAFFLLIIVLFLILLPTYVIITSLVSQTSDLIYSSQDLINKVDLSFCSNKICDNIENNISNLDSLFELIFGKIGEYLSTSATVIFGSVSMFLINLFVFILAFFFLLKDGDSLMKYVKRIIPMKNEYKNALFIKFRDVSSAVFVDTILVAVVQGFLVGVGFWLFNIESPVFWGVIASFFALIPMLGAPIIWVPVVFYLLITGDYFSAIFLSLYCAIIVGFSDNVLRPFLLKQKIQVHSFLILLSILGGIQIFGFFGIFLGPIIISLLVSVLHLYNLDFR